MQSRLTYWLRDIVMVIGLCAITFWYFKPFLSSPHQRIVNDYDGLLITWILDSVTTKLVAGDVFHLFEGNIFYPYPHTLAYSDVFITDSILALPIALTTDEPIALFTYSLILGQLITVLFLYFLLHELTGDRFISFVLAIVFGFSLLRLHYVGHLQMMSIAFVPLSILALVKMKNIGSKPWTIIFWISFLLQTLNSFLPGFFILFTAFGLSVFSLSLRNAWIKHWKLHIILATATGIMLAPVIWIYVFIAQSFSYARPLTDVMHFSLSPDTLATTFFSPALFLVNLIGFIGLVQKKYRSFSLKYWWVGFAAWVMALGPALKWMGSSVKIPFHIPLPYLVFYYLVPGFTGFRTPSRWIVLWALLWIIASGVVWVQLPKKLQYGLASMVLVLALWNIPVLPVRRVPSRAEYPLVYYWLQEQPSSVILELPIFRWGNDDFSKQETYRMLYSTLHRHRLVNGYSGFSPPEWEKMVRDIGNGYVSPGHGGVNLIVVHEEEYQRLNWPIPTFDSTELFRSGSDVVYRRN